MSSAAQRAELQSKIWKIANDVRGSVDGWDFKQYVLGTLFYRFISENFSNYIEGGDESVKYAELDDSIITEEIKEDAIKTKGYFIYPSQLFANIAKNANSNDTLNTELKTIFDAIESSANGYPSELDIKGLFADFDTTSNRLGNTVRDKNSRLAAVIKGVEDLDFGRFEDNQIDLFGDASGNDIMKISCWGGKLSAYVNLPNAIRPNNVQPFQLSDCIKIELVRNQVIEHMRSYLQKHLKDKYSDEFLSMMSVTKMECNLTIKCVGNCKPKDVIRLFERSFAKVTVYKETDPNGKTHRKPERGITTTKPHEWVLKVYDKTFQQRQAGNLKVESNLIRVELVFLDRMLDRMYSTKKSLEDILTRKAIKTLIDQYQVTFDEICKKNITPMLNACVQEIFESLTCSTPRKEVSETLIKCKELIVDTEVLRKALKKWYKN